MRKLLIVGVAAVLVVMAILMALSFLLDVDRYRPEAEQRATAALGRQVSIGKLKLTLLKGGLTAENLTIADDPQFGTDPFLTSSSVNIGVDLPGLIFHKQLNVHSFLIHAPKLVLVQDAQGKWNYSTLSKNTGSNAPSAGGGTPEFTIGKFTLDDGEVLVRHLGTGRTSEYSKLRLVAENISPTANFPYEFSATTPGGGTIGVKGTFGPIAKEFEQTPITAEVTVKNFDIAATGFLDPNSPLKGTVDVDAHVKSDGTRSNVVAKVVGNKMCLAAGCTPSAKPIEIDAEANYLLAGKLANLSSGQVKLGIEHRKPGWNNRSEGCRAED